jgi:reactive intermediate/imine deaminase
MRIFFLLAASAIVACAHQSANVPEPITAASPEPAPAASSEPAASTEPVTTPEPATAAPAAAPAPATVAPAAPAVAAIPAERRAVQSASAPKVVGPYSHAIQVPAGRVVFLSGQIAVDPVKDRLIDGDVVKQTERVMKNLKAVLDAAGATFDDVVKTTIFVTDMADFPKVSQVYGRYFRNAPPARATVQVAGLSRGGRVAIEGVAVKGGAASMTPARVAVTSSQAPRAIGPYSQAIDVAAGSFVFVSGQIPLDPATGELVQGDIGAQTERVMENVKAVLAASGATLDDVVKTNLYIADMNDFTKINETYARYFQKTPPARATLQMAALPRGARIEIECVAATGGSTRVGAVQSAQAPAAAGASQGIGVTPVSFLFVSGQIPLDPATGQPVSGDVGVQTERVMENLKAVLEAGGASFDKVVKTTIFVADIADVAKINDTYGRYFHKTPPARATVQVGALPRGARVEIDCVAAL